MLGGYFEVKSSSKPLKFSFKCGGGKSSTVFVFLIGPHHVNKGTPLGEPILERAKDAGFFDSAHSKEAFLQLKTTVSRDMQTKRKRNTPDWFVPTWTKQQKKPKTQKKKKLKLYKK